MKGVSGLSVVANQANGFTYVTVGHREGVGIGHDPSAICAAVRQVLSGVYRIIKCDVDLTDLACCKASVEVAISGDSAVGTGSGEYVTSIARAIVDAVRSHKRAAQVRQQRPSGRCDDLKELLDMFRPGWITLDSRSGRYYATYWRGRKVELRVRAGKLRLQVVGHPLYYEDQEGLVSLLQCLSIIRAHREAISLRAATMPETVAV